jgi:hypothetical protein
MLLTLRNKSSTMISVVILGISCTIWFLQPETRSHNLAAPCASPGHRAWPLTHADEQLLGVAIAGPRVELLADAPGGAFVVAAAGADVRHRAGGAGIRAAYDPFSACFNHKDTQIKPCKENRCYFSCVLHAGAYRWETRGEPTRRPSPLLLLWSCEPPLLRLGLIWGVGRYGEEGLFIGLIHLRFKIFVKNN